MRNKLANIELKEENRLLNLPIVSITFLSFMLLGLIFYCSINSTFVIALSQDCIISNDCVSTTCPGAIGICSEGKCKYSECVLESKNSNFLRNNEQIDNYYYTYSNDIIDNLNLSKYNVKSNSGFYESVLDWVRFNRAVIFAVIVLISIGLAIFISALWEFIKASLVAKIIVGVLGITIILSIILITRVNPDFFSKIAVGDFSSLSFSNVDELTTLHKNNQDRILSQTSFSRQYAKAIDQEINFAKEVRIKKDNNSVSIIMMEFNTEDSALKYIDEKISGTNKTRKVLNMLAYVYETNLGEPKTYRILSDNKIYLITGMSDDVEYVTQELFSGKISEKNNYFENIRIEYSIDSCINTNIISFDVYDIDETMSINNYSIIVTGVGGFKMEYCLKTSYGYSCEFSAKLAIGTNNVAVNIIEKIINGTRDATKIITKKEAIVSYDPIKPNSNIELYDKNRRAKIIFSDTGSGIERDSQYYEIIVNDRPMINKTCSPEGLKIICDITFYDSIIEGENEIQVSVKDKCENIDTKNMQFTFDNTPPRITLVQNEPKIIEIIDGSGIKRMSVSGKDYNPNDCMIINEIYSCTLYNIGLNSSSNKVIVEAEDYSGNVERKYI